MQLFRVWNFRFLYIFAAFFNQFFFKSELENDSFLMKNSVVSFFSNSFFKNITSRYPGSNQGPFDLQSNALPTELSWLGK